MNGEPTSRRLRARLLWLISLRVVIVTTLLGAGILVKLRSDVTWPRDPFFFLLGLTYALTIAYIWTLRVAERRRWLVNAQFGLDTCLVSALVLITGGPTSVFTPLYALPILAASAVEGRRAGIGVAGLSSLLHTSIILAQYSPEISGLGLGQPATTLPPVRVAAYTVGLDVLGFMAVAGLSGYLAERLRTADARLEQASVRIADLQALNQYVIDSLTSGLATTDDAGVVLTFNPSAERITGRHAASAVGQSVFDVLPISRDIIPRLGSGEPASVQTEVFFRHPDGQPLEIEVRLARLVTPSGPTGWIVMFDDVTDARRLEREHRVRQRLAAVGEMAAGIAHEIRNPLASMSGSIQILSHELRLSADQKKLMEIVLKESERLNETVGAFLTYAKPGAFEMRRLDLRSVIHETELLLRYSVEFEDRHRLEVVESSAPVWLLANEGQIRQILWNLATNALRAMPEGGCLSIAAETRDDEVLLRVSDTGVGMATDQLDRMFEPFHGSFTRGTGLGLAIVHRIVSDYGGRLQVDSTEGRGTTILVHLPHDSRGVTAPLHQAVES